MDNSWDEPVDESQEPEWPPAPPSDEEIIQLMMEHETIISLLYTTFAQLFEEGRDFWQQLAADERSHVQCLELLREKITERIFVPGAYRFNRQAVKYCVRYAGEQLHLAETGQLSHQRAFELAEELERSMLEKEFFRVIKGDAEETIRILRILQQATEKHLALIGKFKESIFAKGQG